MSSVEELPALLEMIEQMRADGYGEDEIEFYLKSLDTQAWEKVTEEMRVEGKSEADIYYFWKEVDSFGDTEPEDMIDADDEVR